MATTRKASKAGHELTYFPPRNCWAKFYKGKRYYCPLKVRGKSDRKGYADSLEWWIQKRAEIDTGVKSQFTLPEQNQIGAELFQPPNLNGVYVSVADFNSLGITTAATPSGPHGDSPIKELVDAYLDEKQLDTKSGKISVDRYSNHRVCMDVFKAFFCDKLGFTNISQVTTTDLESYRLTLIQHTTRESKADGKISPRTAQLRLSTAKAFFHWLESRDYIEVAPKAVRRKDYSTVPLTPPNPEIFTFGEINRLWTYASKRTRLYIALALNCGYTETDIATLTHSMVDWKQGLILRLRNKTKAKSPTPQIHKLWPVTLELLSEEKSKGKGDDLLLVCENGSPLMKSRINDNGKATIIRVITLAFNRIKKTQAVNITRYGAGFGSFRNTSATHIDEMDHTLTSFFLAHADPSMKKHYVRRELSRLVKAKHYQALFAAIDDLGKLYGLTM